MDVAFADDEVIGAGEISITVMAVEEQRVDLHHDTDEWGEKNDVGT